MIDKFLIALGIVSLFLIITLAAFSLMTGQP